MAKYARILKLHSEEMEPSTRKKTPSTYPLRFKRYGKLSTALPIAEALNEKMLALNEPLPNLEKVR